MAVLRCVALLAGAATFACTPERAVTVRIRPPSDEGATDGGMAPGARILREIYRPGDRCIVFGAVPLDTSDARGVRVSVMRTRAIVTDGAPSCLGPTGSVVLGNLLETTPYVVWMVILDERDLSGDAGPRAAGGFDDPGYIVSNQDLPLRDNPSASFICLSDPARGFPTPSVLQRGLDACRGAAARPSCTLDISYGGQCPTVMR